MMLAVAVRRLFRPAGTRCICSCAVRRQKAAAEFQPLDLGRRRQAVRQNRRAYDRRQANAPPRLPRSERMATDQDWPSVWPAPRTFQPHTVPLPVRQSYVARPDLYATIGKDANAELMKIANFLHLTPPAIERHCLALRRFCTAWPEGLDDEKMDRLLPMEVVTQDFVHATPSIRHPDARLVVLHVPLDTLQHTARSRDKLLRLLYDRHDADTGLVTLVSDRCPFRRQNYDHIMHLLTVCYFESHKHEPWEDGKQRADQETFVWEGSPAQQACSNLGADVDQEVLQRYVEGNTKLLEGGEDEETLQEYRQAVLQILNLPDGPAVGRQTPSD